MSSWFHFPVSFRPYSLANFLICGVRAMLDCKQVVRLLRQRRNCLLERALGRAEPFLAYRSSDMPTRPNHRQAPRVLTGDQVTAREDLSQPLRIPRPGRNPRPRRSLPGGVRPCSLAVS